MSQQPEFWVEIEGPDGQWIPVGYNTGFQLEADNLWTWLTERGLNARMLTWQLQTVRQGVQVKPGPYGIPQAPATAEQSVSIFRDTVRNRGITEQPQTVGQSARIFEGLLRDRGIEVAADTSVWSARLIEQFGGRGGGVSTATVPDAVAINDVDKHLVDEDAANKVSAELAAAEALGDRPYPTAGRWDSTQPGPPVYVPPAEDPAVMPPLGVGWRPTSVANEVIARQAAGAYDEPHPVVQVTPDGKAEAVVPEIPGPEPVKVDVDNLWTDDGSINGAAFFKDQPDTTKDDLPAVAPLPGEPGYLEHARAALNIRRDPQAGARMISRGMG